MSLNAPIRDVRRGRHSITINVNGKEAVQYDAGTNGRISHCWIESIHGAEFSVTVVEHQTATSAVSMVEVFADGKKVGMAIVKPDKPCHFLGSWLDKHTLKPFIFTRAAKILPGQVARNESENAEEGRISVKISEVALHAISNWMDPPPPLPEFPTAVFSDEQSGWHRVALSPQTRHQTYFMQASKFTTVPFDAAAPAPIVVVEFLYRPRKYLEAKSIIVDHSSRMMNATSDAQLKSTIAQLFKRPPPTVVSEIDEERVFKRPFSPRRGASIITDNKSHIRSTSHFNVLKNHHDQMRATASPRRNSGRQLFFKPVLGNSVSRERGHSLARTEGSTTFSFMNGGESNANGSVSHLSDKLYTGRNRTEEYSYKSANLPFSEGPSTRRAFSHSADTPHINAVKAEGAAGDGDGVNRFLRFPSQVGDGYLDGNSCLPAEEIDHGRKLLASMRRWTDSLMGIAVEGDRSGPVAEMAEALIKDTDKRYRTLQAMVLKSKKSLP